MWDHKYPYTDFHELNLDWLLQETLKNSKHIETLEEWRAKHEPEYEALKAFVDALNRGDLPESFRDALYEWMTVNGIDLVGDLVNMVFFGLTNEGYFVAYIPDSWDEITFGTTQYDDFPVGIEYGHLTLSY